MSGHGMFRPCACPAGDKLARRPDKEHANGRSHGSASLTAQLNVFFEKDLLSVPQIRVIELELA